MSIAPLVRQLLVSIEGEPLRKDLEETPDRVERMMSELFDGYSVDIDSLFKTFDGEGKDQIVVVKDISTWSTCEHHLLPFHLSVSVAYLPVERVIGVSKIERLVHAYAHRLQLQERIAKQIAETIMSQLQPQGVIVVIEGVHGCMRCRGVRSSTSKVTNSVILGSFREDIPARVEALTLLLK